MRELLQQALEALMFKVSPRKVLKVIAAIEEELSKPEQAAGKCGCGANLYVDENGKPCSKAKSEQDHGFDRTASHMAGEYVDTKQQNVNTSEERVQKSDECVHEPEQGIKHGDKVSLTIDDAGQIHVSPEPEPWLWIRKRHDFEGSWISNRLPTDPENWDAVYKAPPRKEWVSLSDGEIRDIWLGIYKITDATDAFARAIEAELRSKNETL